jgi:nickel-type superoxide dismutase maturation protease
LQYSSVYTEGVPRLLPLRRFVIADTSMEPTLRPGDRVLIATWLRPRVGDLVVFQHPEWRKTIAVKRIARIEPSGDVLLTSDNPNVGTDSRHFGPVPRSLVHGKVVYRYLPGTRRGRV